MDKNGSPVLPSKDNTSKDSQDGPSAGSKEVDASDRKLTVYAALSIAAVSLGGMTYGIEVGGAAPALQFPGFRHAAGYPEHAEGGGCGKDAPSDPIWVTDQIGWIVGVFQLAALVGAPAAGFLADRYGRRFVIFSACLLYFLGAVVEAAAGLSPVSSIITDLYVGRVLTGLGNGFICMVSPLYGAELAPQSWRGKTVTLFQFMITVGIEIMGIVDVPLSNWEQGWRIAFALQAVTVVVLFFLTIFMPESPRFYVKKGDNKKALAVLNQLNGISATDNSESYERKLALAELVDIEQEVERAEETHHTSWMELFKGVNLTPLIVGVGIAACQKVSGVNWVLGYFPTIAMQLCISPFIATMILNTVNLLATIVAFPIVDRFGRKIILVWGTVTVILCFAIVSGVLYSVSDLSANPGIGWFALVMYCVFQAAFAIAWGPMGWLVPAEVFPIHLRGKGMGIATSANMLIDFALLSKLSIILMDPSVIGVPGTTLLFMLLTLVIAFPMVTLWTPETGKVTLEDMRPNLNFKFGGGGDTDAGTWSEFTKRNLDQTLKVFTCRSVDPKVGMKYPPGEAPGPSVDKELM